MNIYDTINGCKLDYLHAELLANDPLIARLEALRIYSDARGMARRVAAEARRQLAGMQAAGYSAGRPYRIEAGSIIGCCTGYNTGHGVVRNRVNMAGWRCAA